MNIILAADGHVGSATAKELLRMGERVIVVLHDAKTADEWKKQGAEIAIADVNDPQSLKQVFNKGKKAFILNPPAAPSTDTVTTEKKSVASILKALENSSIKKVVAESTYGAQPGKGVGDLGVLFDLERGLAKLTIPAIIIRAAYYMSNWAMSLKTVQQEGIVHTLYPIDFALPMVSPDDIGYFAAHFLSEPIENTGIQYVEGPKEYSTNEVAAAFSALLNKPVKAVEIPKEQWIEALQRMGFSVIAAESMAAMTSITLEKKYDKIDIPNRGTTTLQEYITNVNKN